MIRNMNRIVSFQPIIKVKEKKIENSIKPMSSIIIIDDVMTSAHKELFIRLKIYNGKAYIFDVFFYIRFDCSTSRRRTNE